MKIIIADTSSLILFSKIQKLDILKDLFNDVQITPEVASEFGDFPKWIKIHHYSNIDKYKEFEAILGKGEASAIALALEIDNPLLLIDEKKGRKIAKENSISIIGSLGIVLLAKQKGKITSAKEVLELIQKTDFRISNSIINFILKESGEHDL